MVGHFKVVDGSETITEREKFIDGPTKQHDILRGWGSSKYRKGGFVIKSEGA